MTQSHFKLQAQHSEIYIKNWIWECVIFDDFWWFNQILTKFNYQTKCKTEQE